MASAEKTTVEGLECPYHYGYKNDWRSALPQFIAVSVKNVVLLAHGMTLGFQTILIPAVSSPNDSGELYLNASQISWISSLNLIVVPLGSAVSGLITTPMGRRRAMQAVNAPFIIAWLIFHFTTSTGHLYAALILNGLAGGLLEAPVLTYVAEITQPHLRGALTATSSMCVIIGIFIQFLFGLLLNWRSVALVNILFPILAIGLLFFVPESPHWLVSRKRYNEARKSLQWLRGWIGPDAVEAELKDIQALFKNRKVKGETNNETLKDQLALYFDKTFLVPFFLVSYSFFVGHFSGMTTLQVYAVSIFQMLEAPLDKYYATLILGILQIVGAGVCVTLVHYTGKRPLTLVSTAGAAVCCALVAGYQGYIINYGIPAIESTANISTSNNVTGTTIDAANNPYSWMPTTLLMLLALISHTGIRMLPWILIGEVYTAKTRSSAAGLSGAVGYIFNFLANKSYLSMVDTLSIWGTYGFYSLICITGCVVFYFVLPETEGKKLNEIEDHFAGVKKLTNEVYRAKKRQKKEESKIDDSKGKVNPAFEMSSSDV